MQKGWRGSTSNTSRTSSSRPARTSPGPDDGRRRLKTYDRSDPGTAGSRAHPWTVATTNPTSRYYDFRAAPALIRTALEDLVPWAAWPAVETFYGLVEWINGPASSLESNDCAFEGPSASRTLEVPKALEATGRLMVLWRDLPLNLLRDNTDWLSGTLHDRLSRVDPSLAHGAVGTTVYPVQYTTLPLAEAQQAGFQLMLSFWAWGDTTEEVMENLDRTLQGLSEALRAVEQAARDIFRGQQREQDSLRGAALARHPASAARRP